MSWSAGTPFEVTSIAIWNSSLRNAAAQGRTVIVDFHATWCGPCKQIAPVYSNLAKQFPQVVFLRVDVDALAPIAQKYKISAMPTFLAMKSINGQPMAPIETIKGADPQGITRMVKTHAGPNPPVAPLPEAAAKAKDSGNEAFKAGNFEEAIKFYSQAIELAPESHTLYGNRAFSYMKLDPPNSSLALTDAEKATSLDPSWGKGYVRLGEALQLENKLKESAAAFEQAVQKSEGLVQKEAAAKLETVKNLLAE